MSFLSLVVLRTRNVDIFVCHSRFYIFDIQSCIFDNDVCLSEWMLSFTTRRCVKISVFDLSQSNLIINRAHIFLSFLNLSVIIACFK